MDDRRNRRQNQMLQPVHGQKTGSPPAQIQRLSAPERRQPAELDGEYVNQENSRQEHRDRDPHNAHRHHHLRAQAIGLYGAIDSHRHGNENDDEDRCQHQLESGGKFVEDDFKRRLFEKVGGAEIAVHRVPKEPAVLYHEGIAEPHLVAQGLTLSLRNRLPDQLAQRIAEIVLNGKADQRDDQHHHHGLTEPLYEKR